MSEILAVRVKCYPHIDMGTLEQKIKSRMMLKHLWKIANVINIYMESMKCKHM